MREITHAFHRGVELVVEDEAEARLQRLHRVLGYVEARAELDGIEIFGKLSCLKDHEGFLTVSWKAAPTYAEKRFFNLAWENGSVGDGADNVDHEVV